MNAESRSLYRRFYRAALFAVHYSNRSRPHVLLRLENLFRSPILPTTPVIQRTERFLRRAGEDRGIENKILKNFCDVEFYRKDIRSVIRTTVVFGMTAFVGTYIDQY